MAQASWAVVSGTLHPRAARIRPNASSIGQPPRLSKRAARSEDRPMPMRQWIAIRRPLLAAGNNSSKSIRNAAALLGTDRSSIGHRAYSMPRWMQAIASSPRSSSTISASVSSETTVWIPCFARESISSTSHSPPLGRAIIASCILWDVIQCSFTFMGVSRLVSW